MTQYAFGSGVLFGRNAAGNLDPAQVGVASPGALQGALMLERLLKEGKENLFTADEIAAMKTLNSGTMPDGRMRVAAYKRTLDEFNIYSKSVLDVAEQAGLIDGESRKLWEHDFYVPFYRMSQENEISGPTKIKGLVRQKASISTSTSCPACCQNVELR